MFGGIFNTAKDYWIRDIAGNTNNKNFAKTFVKNNFWWNSGVGAAEYNGIWFLRIILYLYYPILINPNVQLLNQGGVSCSFPGTPQPIPGDFAAAVHGCRDPRNEQLTPFLFDRLSLRGYAGT